MSGSLTRGGGENVPGIPGACAPQFYVSGKRPIRHNPLLLREVLCPHACICLDLKLNGIIMSRLAYFTLVDLFGKILCYNHITGNGVKLRISIF